ncbi:MAG: M20 family metallopeptidase [Cytophagales bacterium]
MQQIISKIKAIAKEEKENVISIRRHIHQNPELSFQEHQTMAYVSEKLSEMGVEHKTGVAGTGIVASIKGKNPNKKTIALRADMDALPIEEQNEVSYKSKNQGVMHACGHDVHTSSLLGAAKILSKMTDDFEGCIQLFFQPGEELIPGGASLMIKEGVLENPKVETVIGQHVMPQIPVGKVGFREGMYMASADEIYLTVVGKGGHAAMPDSINDPVLATAHMLVALQQVVSRIANPKIPSVLSFGKIIAQGATNIIPNEVKVEGTFRTLDEEWRAKAHEKINQIVSGIADAMGVKAELEIRKGYPYLKNHVETTKIAKTAAIEFLGAENVIDLDIWMAAEDFAYYTQKANACFYRLGVRNESKNIVSGVHTPTFDIDEDVLEIGSSLMAYIALKELEN